MKEIYKLLNEVQLDEKEFVELDASDIEKAQVKNQLKQRITKKKKSKSWMKQLVAATLVIGLSGTVLGLAYPTYAGKYSHCSRYF